MSEDTINQAIQLSKTGRSLDARKLLRPLLEVEPENEKAWLWYANSFDTVEEKIKALKNCLIYCPNSKMANDGIRLLMTKLPTSEPSTHEDASDLAADLQKESVQFNDLESQGRDEDGEENKYDVSASTSSFEDQEAIPNLDDRLQGTEFQNFPVDEGIYEQERTAVVKEDVDIQEPRSKPEDRPDEAIVKTLRAPDTRHPTDRKNRTSFIIFTILGVILFIVLALIITILLFSA